MLVALPEILPVKVVAVEPVIVRFPVALGPVSGAAPLGGGEKMDPLMLVDAQLWGVDVVLGP